MLENYTSNQHQQQTNHYYNDSHKRGGKRQPCPQCKSLTQYHENNHGKLKCYACGYRPGQTDSAFIPIAPKIAKPLCDCGNPLNNPNQVKTNKCFFCQTNEAHPLGKNTSGLLGGFAYAKNKGLSGLILGMVGARVINNSLSYPVENEHGQIGYQVISDKGKKFYAYPKHDSDSLFHAFIGNREGDLIACEGLATAISIKTALPESNIIICGNADNLIKAAKLYGNRIKAIATDNDKNGAGLAKATHAASICGAKIWLCPVESDFNDLHMMKGLQAIRESFDYAGNINLNLAYQSGIKHEVINSLTDFKAENGEVTILLAAMGTGKTKIVASQLSEESKTFAYISYLRSLDGDASEKLGLISYQKAKKATHAKMSQCINSIESYDNNFETIFIDEAHAVIDNLTLKDTTIEEQKRTFDNLIAKMSFANRVIFATATMTLSHIQAIKVMAAKAGMSVKITVSTEQGRDKDIELIDFETFTSNWQNALANGLKVFLFCDAPNNVKAIELQAKELFPNAKILAIHGDNAHEHVAGLAQNYLNYDMVIVSPSVTAGVSLETPYFDLTMAWYVGNHLSPQDATQALARYRCANKVFVCIDKFAKSDHAQPFNVDKELEKIKEDYLIQLLKGKRNEDLKHALTNYRFTDFDRICATNRAHAEFNKAQFAPMFLDTIKAQGWHVSELGRGDGRAARMAHSKAKAEVIMAECRAIATKDIISDFEADILSKKMELSQDERYALKRYQAHTIFGTNEIDDIKEIFQDNLIQKARLLAQFQNPHYANVKFEQDMLKAVTGSRSIVGLQNRIANNEFVTALFKVAKIMHGHGVIDLACATFNKNSDFTELVNVLEKYNLFARKRTEKLHVLVANELRNLGFTVTSQRAKGARGENRYYEFTVTGFNALVERGMVYFSNKFAMSLVSISRQMIIIESPITRSGHQTSLTHDIFTPKVTACAHEVALMAGDYPTCQNCGAQWANIDFYFMELQAKEAGVWAV